jgi:hypothetical protein
VAVRVCAGMFLQAAHFTTNRSHVIRFQDLARPPACLGRTCRTRSHRIRRSLQVSLNVRKAAGSIVREGPREIRRTATPIWGRRQGISRSGKPAKIKLLQGYVVP